MKTNDSEQKPDVYVEEIRRLTELKDCLDEMDRADVQMLMNSRTHRALLRAWEPASPKRTSR